QIDPESSDLPMRRDSIPGRREAFQDFSFEVRLPALFLLFQSAHQARGILRMLNQLSPKVVCFQVVVWTERMNDPHLVSSAASGDIKTLFEQFLIAQRE